MKETILPKKKIREHGIFFTYDADNDYYICSQEKNITY